MKHLISAVAVMAFVAVAGVASAGDIKGVIKSVNGNTRTVTIGDVAYVFPLNVDLNIAVGQTVTLTFEAANGRNQVSKVVK